MKEREDLYYKLGKVILVILIAVAVFFCFFGTAVLELVPGCYFQSVTGLYCPGCGGTRAFFSLLRGDFVRSFMFHPAVLYVAVTYVVFMITKCICIHKEKWNKMIFHLEYFAYAGIAVIVIQWLVKVIALVIFHVRWI